MAGAKHQYMERTKEGAIQRGHSIIRQHIITLKSEKQEDSTDRINANVAQRRQWQTPK